MVVKEFGDKLLSVDSSSLFRLFDGAFEDFFGEINFRLN